ncbi:hypothetical protein AMATHDRAFT_5583 [Amanita thiersii Skay4041]|uniref:PITH domain-containing protein n=1 Tax=Amanita thiersii Skay4041 TaxID=703135 RepID=A0A2A9NLU6_9AGAR|nr:hypothetical protein AMATHDRAFT_5583 [Amanita thiersii Skay4041]
MATNSNADGVGDFGNLYGSIDRDNVHGLNLSVPESAKDIIKPWDQREDTSRYADSGVDDQMIIHIPFIESVRVKSILLKLGRGEYAPRLLHIFANHPMIVDFADAEGMKPQMSVALLTGEPGVVEYPLRVATLSSVTSLSLFFKNSEGGDISRVYYIGFKGDIRSSRTGLSSSLQVPAPNAADAKLVDRVREKGAAGQQTTAR